jgi:hypothetical protein
LSSDGWCRCHEHGRGRRERTISVEDRGSKSDIRPIGAGFVVRKDAVGKSIRCWSAQVWSAHAGVIVRTANCFPKAKVITGPEADPHTPSLDDKVGIC